VGVVVLIGVLGVLGVAVVGVMLGHSGKLPGLGASPTPNLATSAVEVTRRFWGAVGTTAVADYVADDYPMRSVVLGAFSKPTAGPESISIVGTPVESGPVAFVTTEVCTSASGSRAAGTVVVELHQQSDGSWLVANMVVSTPYQPVASCP
jgi:hypothetical protein